MQSVGVLGHKGGEGGIPELLLKVLSICGGRGLLQYWGMRLGWRRRPTVWQACSHKLVLAPKQVNLLGGLFSDIFLVGAEQGAGVWQVAPLAGAESRCH